MKKIFWENPLSIQSLEKMQFLYTFIIYSLFLSSYNQLFSMKRQKTLDLQTSEIIAFLSQQYHEKQRSEALLQSDPERKKTPIAVAFNPKKDIHEIAISFNDSSIEIRDSRNTSNLLHLVQFYEPVHSLIFTPWESTELILEQRSFSGSNIRFLPITEKLNIAAVNSHTIQQEILNDHINNIFFNSESLGFVILTIDQQQQNLTLFGKEKLPNSMWRKKKPSPISKVKGQLAVSPLFNYEAHFRNTTVDIHPVIDAETQNRKVTIQPNAPIEKVTFSFDGEIVAIMTKHDIPEEITFHRVGLYYSATGQCITVLDNLDQKEILSVQLNGDGSVIAIIYKDEQAQLISFDNPAACGLKKKIQEKDATIVRDILIKAIQNKSNYKISSWSEYKAWKNLSEDERSFLRKILAIKVPLSYFMSNVVTSWKFLTPMAIIIAYLIWHMQNNFILSLS